MYILVQFAACLKIQRFTQQHIYCMGTDIFSQKKGMVVCFRKSKPEHRKYGGGKFIIIIPVYVLIIGNL